MTAPRLQNSAPAERRMPGQGPPRWGTMEGGGEGKQSLCWDPLATGDSKQSREGQPSSRWARLPPLTGPRRLRGPLPPGPARRPSRERVVPGGAEGRGAGPCRWSPRPSPLTTWRPRGKGVPDASARQWPFDATGRPPPTGQDH